MLAMSKTDAVTSAEVERHLRAAGLPVPAQVGVLAAFLSLLVRWNRVYNLTGIREVDDLVERHLVESLALRPLLAGATVADVGTGAGLPGLPLAIVEPERQFTLIESRGKPVRFLRHVVGALRLRNVTVAHERAERLRVEQPFATVLARAVAPPPELLAHCAHLTAPGSILLLLTAAHLQDAFRDLAPALGWRTVAAPVKPRGKASIVLLERM